MSRNVIFVERINTLKSGSSPPPPMCTLDSKLNLSGSHSHSTHPDPTKESVLPTSVKGVSIHLGNKAKNQGNISNSSLVPIPRASWFPYAVNSILKKVWSILSPQSIPTVLLCPSLCYFSIWLFSFPDPNLPSIGPVLFPNVHLLYKNIALAGVA